jgi:hypothetical protein
MVPGAQDKDLNRKSAAFGVHGGELGTDKILGVLA